MRTFGVRGIRSLWSSGTIAGSSPLISLRFRGSIWLQWLRYILRIGARTMPCETGGAWRSWLSMHCSMSRSRHTEYKRPNEALVAQEYANYMDIGQSASRLVPTLFGA